MARCYASLVGLSSQFGAKRMASLSPQALLLGTAVIDPTCYPQGPLDLAPQVAQPSCPAMSDSTFTKPRGRLVDLVSTLSPVVRWCCWKGPKTTATLGPHRCTRVVRSHSCCKGFLQQLGFCIVKRGRPMPRTVIRTIQKAECSSVF